MFWFGHTPRQVATQRLLVGQPQVPPQPAWQAATQVRPELHAKVAFAHIAQLATQLLLAAQRNVPRGHPQTPAWQVRPLAQAAQAAPPVPQAMVEGTWQALLAQQPFGHEAALQTQALLTHAWPTPHAAPLPQRQAPFTHALAVRALQATHAAPRVPHDCSDGMAQVLPLQQPVGQVMALHVEQMRLTHAPLPAQTAQAAPPVPQAPLAVPGWQTLLAQQPIGQEAALHTHAPLTHACPARQAAPFPQRQTPAVQRPFSALQAAQAAPPVPQAIAVLPAWQVLPAQQPIGQEAALQTHWLLTQRWPAPQAAPLPQRH